MNGTQERRSYTWLWILAILIALSAGAGSGYAAKGCPEEVTVNCPQNCPQPPDCTLTPGPYECECKCVCEDDEESDCTKVNIRQALRPSGLMGGWEFEHDAPHVGLMWDVHKRAHAYLIWMHDFDPNSIPGGVTCSTHDDYWSTVNSRPTISCNQHPGYEGPRNLFLVGGVWRFGDGE